MILAQSDVNFPPPASGLVKAFQEWLSEASLVERPVSDYISIRPETNRLDRVFRKFAGLKIIPNGSPPYLKSLIYDCYLSINTWTIEYFK